MKDAYRLLLRFYPRDYRVKFALEMQRAFESASVASRGRSGHVQFAARELVGLLLGTAREWMVKLATDPSVRGRAMPDRLLMRPPGVSWEAFYGDRVREE
jgi:hypothetical protein